MIHLNTYHGNVNVNEIEDSSIKEKWRWNEDVKM